jgi:hypothetical protein
MTRPRTIYGYKRLTADEIEEGRRAVALPVLRPETRGDCVDGPRPCPFVSCQYNLYLDVDPATGTIKINFPDLDIDEIPATCALDLADEGEHTLEQIAAVTNVTRERIRQIEERAARGMRRWKRLGTDVRDVLSHAEEIHGRRASRDFDEE